MFLSTFKAVTAVPGWQSLKNYFWPESNDYIYTSCTIDQFAIFFSKSIPGWGVTNVGGTAADFPAKLLEVEVKFRR